MSLVTETFLKDLVASGDQIIDIVDPTQGPTAVNFFDYFFSDNLGKPDQDFDAFVQWDVSDGSVDLVGGTGPGVFGAPPEQEAGRYVDLGGSTGDPGLFETRLALPVVAGQTYNLSFDFRSTEGDLNEATATIGDQSFTVSSDTIKFQHFSQTFTATETGLFKLAFQGDEGDTDGSGIGIDGVLFGPDLNVDGLVSAIPGLVETQAGEGSYTLSAEASIGTTGFSDSAHPAA